MATPVNHFEIIFQDRTVPVQELSLSGRPMFVIPLPDKKPLVITTATGADGQVFWTSIPEGKLELAQAIGQLIEAHFKKAS
ncbi:hypothetical protein [Paraflavitalea pollutisoli]|uniref:hypothetical protein n=1 Tax=Paraflavitalea pollutisoli TaxID=3034143 RepID=UPI0023EB0C27|nr:hypothetical protein [Paraflavitalea sp. H1-2-19X]